jgi:hypothetical protein
MIPVQTQLGASPGRHQTATYSNRSGGAEGRYFLGRAFPRFVDGTSIAAISR